MGLLQFRRRILAQNPVKANTRIKPEGLKTQSGQRLICVCNVSFLRVIER